ncbi:DUF222 domain-containing protein, partial [Humibacter sp. RRB41]|uniref:DUF222 domain-containing protein n=1 Tax=Humibacter sp. RRB41 TaxID=2919946 RepID=UPI001FAAAA95
MFDTEAYAASGSDPGFVCDVVDDLAGASADVPPEDVFENDGVWNQGVIPVRHVRRLSAVEILDFVFDDAVSHQTVVNRESARQMFAVHEAFQIAREYVRVYVPVGAADTSVGVDDVDFSERAVAFDLAHRLHVSENLVRAYDHQAGVLTGSLPRLCELFLAGRISAQHVRAAVDSADGIPTETLMTAYDERLALIAEGLRVGEFARRCRLLRERLCADTLQERHDREVEK